jgi:hypothetical protein
MANTLARMRQIVGLSADWAANNLTLGDGEIALERLPDGTVKARIGDGVTPFETCPYLGGALDLAFADGRYVNEAETFTAGGAAAANKWPRLNAGGMLDPSLVNLPAALHYKGATDALGQPPAGAVAGDLYIVLYAGTVDASWGSPAAGTACKPGDWLVKNNAGQWQLIPIQTAGTVTEAPTDGSYYARQNSGWSAVKTAFVQKAGDQMTGALGIGVAPIGTRSSLETAGDIALRGDPSNPSNHIGFNATAVGSGWQAQQATFAAVIRFENSSGNLQFFTTPIAAASAGGAVTPIYAGGFDIHGGFNVGTTGGDYGVNWSGIFRRDQDAETLLGLINGDTTANAAVGLRLITGTGNSFTDINTVDNAGAPYAGISFGSAVQFWKFSFGGAEVGRWLSGGSLGLKCQPVAGTSSALQLGADMSFSVESPNLMFNLYYAGAAWHTYGTGAPFLMRWDGQGNFMSVFGQQVANSGPGIANLYEFMRIVPNNFAGNPSLRLGAAGVDMSRSYSALLQVSFDSNAGGDGIACLTPRVGGTAIQFQTSWTTVAGSIVPNGSSTSYGTSSDARLKTNIADAPDAGAIIDAIRVRQFDWRGDGAHVAFGMIAQELANHFPDAVMPPDPRKDEDELGNPWMTDNAKLVPLLIREIQSLRARVAKLELPA